MSDDNITSGFFFWLFVSGFLAIAFSLGLNTRTSEIKGDCDKFGAVQMRDKMFDCRMRTDASTKP